MSPFRSILLIVFLAGWSPVVQAIDLSGYNLNYLRNPQSDFRADVRVLEPSKDEFKVLVSIHTEDLSLWKVAYYGQAGYESELHEVLVPQVQSFQDSLLGDFLELTLTTQQNLLVIEFSNLEEESVRFLPVPLTATARGLDLLPMVDSRPYMKRYLNVDALEWGVEDSLYYSIYKENFGPADAPMDEMKPLFPKFDYDTVLFAKSPELMDERLYVVHTDSLADDGITFLKMPPYYPEFRRIEELIPPLKYITTEAEFQSLLNARNPRKTFDEFWLSTFGTKFRARNAIRGYYQSVEEANELFTQFKAGWKTDRGMIYMVFGPPFEVYLDDRGEVWVYEEVEFEFVRVGTVFGDVLGLTRSKKLEKVWFNKVGNLRRTL